MNKSVSVKVYHGYGHEHNLVVYGHVFRFKAKTRQVYSNNLFVNIVHLLKLFILKPYPHVKVRLTFQGQQVYNKTEYDGFFKFEWAAHKTVTAGWHGVKVEALDENDAVMAIGHGQIFVPHLTQYAFISDIDDTVMISHSATLGRRLRELFIKNPRTRKTFKDTHTLYHAFASSHTNANQPNPFFYVSSSEWNLYDYLVETFRFNKMPEGAFLLNQIKRWKDLIRTGRTGHEGKLMRVMRILDAFPNQKFVFIGDNSQQDPVIYTTIARKYPKNIAGIYIRNIRKEKAAQAQALLDEISALHGIKTCLFTTSREAINYSIKTQLIKG
ncbi:phosphatidate phosphatase APP1 [Pedobacter africanus]|uniref:Phosphatidate phosphatase APP1 n=1 Tax=Pedobacter africanus TaxID=151894 RepID=A0ACC6KXA0_9SPHI|nr:phosphatase domain-containing protein [Pedobacter africanus]MDR6783723.1 phosphatidate phosphatase APP1 [Pedobacter africanus]